MALVPRPKWILLIAYLAVVHLLAGLYIRHLLSLRHPTPAQPEANYADTGLSSDTIRQAGDTSLALPAQYAAAAPADKLLIPVAGVKKSDLQDTYTQSRAGGRVHNAIDIMAPGGTPVLAAADGEIAKFFDSKAGGTTIYQRSADGKYVYYYAHLKRRADGIHEGMAVKRGTVIGYVGDTGNAGPGNFHLHFSIIIPDSAGGFWNGTNINPYPVLKDGAEAVGG